MSNGQDIEQVEQLIEKLEKDFRYLKVAVRRIKEEATMAIRTRNTDN